MTNIVRSLVSTRILFQGLRGAAFLRIETDSDASFSQLIGLIAFTIFLQFAIDFLNVGPLGELSLYGLPNLLFKVPVILTAAWALSIVANRRESTLMLAVVISATAISVSILGQAILSALNSRLIKHFISIPDVIYPVYTHLVPAWLALAAAVITIRLFDLSGKGMAYAALSGALFIWMPLAQVGSYQTIWTTPYDPESTATKQNERNALVEERAIYSQPRLLEHALASLSRSQPDKINLYYIGVAGYSEQDVFMKEVRYVSNFFKARFGTIGRSITLINNPKTVLESPAASVTSLRLALNQIGKVMDADKDILFLYLTSHGSQDHRLSFSFGSVRFDSLDPVLLRQMLDNSGIKRRIVVVSSCYSGGFVDPLKNENTLIITASAPEKTSHGCSNEADFTFFGQAYFEDGLRKTGSFIEAFDVANTLIGNREVKEGYKPAQPMMSVGAEIREALDQYASQNEFAIHRSSATSLESNSKVRFN